MNGGLLRLRQYATKVNDIHLSANNAISNSSFLSLSARLDNFAEWLNQQD